MTATFRVLILALVGLHLASCARYRPMYDRREERPDRQMPALPSEDPVYSVYFTGSAAGAESLADAPALALAGQVLAEADSNSAFLFLTVYAVRMSAVALAGLLEEKLRHLPGTIEFGDLAEREEGEGGRLLPTAIFARWSNPG